MGAHAFGGVTHVSERIDAESLRSRDETGEQRSGSSPLSLPSNINVTTPVRRDAGHTADAVIVPAYRLNSEAASLWPYRAFRKASSWSSGRKRFTFALAGFILAIAASFNAIFA
jgi:hypothetical protein